MCNFERVYAVLFLQLDFQQKSALLALHARPLNPQRKMFLSLPNKLKGLLRIAWFLTAPFRTDIQFIFLSLQLAKHELSITNGLELHDVSLEIQDTKVEPLPWCLAAHVDVEVVLCWDCEGDHDEVVAQAGKRKMPHRKFYLIDDEYGLEVMYQICVCLNSLALGKIGYLTCPTLFLNPVHTHCLLPFRLQMRQHSKQLVHADQLHTLSDGVLFARKGEEPMQGHRKVAVSLEKPYQKQPSDVQKLFSLFTPRNHQANFLFLQFLLGKMHLLMLSSLEVPAIEIIAFPL